MATKGRPAGFKMSEEHRTKIANSRILGNLISFAEGDDTKISKAQADVGLALMRKVMPDLSAVTIANEPGEVFKTESALERISSKLAGIAAKAGEGSDTV